MTETTKTTTKMTYEVRYVGAPYGENEQGELVSSHRTFEAAGAARRKLQKNPRYYGSNTKIAVVYNGERSWL